jgi:hypothetical protein
MRYSILFFLFLFTATLTVHAQKEIDEDTSHGLERAYVGFGIGGLGFGSSTYYGRYFSIGASLLGGYMLTKNLSAGVGFEYQYTSYSEIKAKSHLYGGYPFVRYNIKNFFLQTDYDVFTLKVTQAGTSLKNNFDRFFIGAGYFSPAGERGFVNFLLSYDVTYTNNGRFNSPLNTRVFFTF